MARLNHKYDVVIIGAGPVGIYTSIKLAEKGFRILVLEEDKEIGRPKFCTGLISKEAFSKFNLSYVAIENEFKSALILAPSGLKVSLASRDILVYATNRAIFDQNLWRQAKKTGVEFLLDCRCTGLKINDAYVEETIVFDNTEATLKSEVAVLATGIKYNLHQYIGLNKPANFLDCAQVQVNGQGDGQIEVFLGNNIAPHSFAWIVPLKENRLRIGLSTKNDSVFFLRSFLSNLKFQGRLGNDGDDFEITRRPIPLGAIDRTYTNRVLVVGDAAGQVKPTTGGGIYFGLLCADLAAQTIIAAFRKKDFRSSFLCRYEISWKKRIEFDLTMGLYLRKLIADLSDKQIEKLVEFCVQKPIQSLIEKYGDFNHHGKFIKELIKMPSFWKNLHSILINK